MSTFRELETELGLAQDLARTDTLIKLRNEITEERERVDVTGYWHGYNRAGKGLVEYKGRTYECIVLARKCKQFGAKVNLRRTSQGYFVNWA
tara:strand:+ start:443 stop:718 length:276 start_codon:yes stop_codon:yes gene_type:complete